MAWKLSTGSGAVDMTAAQPIRIVGGGLAGLSLGIALRKSGVPAEIIEAGDYPRHRVCGEFITGLDDVSIEKLGIGPAFVGVGFHRKVTWYLRDRIVGQQRLPSPARAISRFVLDARLAKMFVAEGGKLTTHTRYKPTSCDPGLVQTSGRPAKVSSPWIGLKLHVRNFATVDELEFHLGDDSYVGLSSVGDGWTNICGLFRKRPGLRFARDDALPAYLRASGLATLAERLISAEVRPGSRSAVTGFAFNRRVLAQDGVYLGDACATIPPFTGNGMAMAFISAALALDPLVRWARGECSWIDVTHHIHDAVRREFRLRLAIASILHPFLLNRMLQPCLGGALRSGLLPITTLYRLLH